jgi:hypothetical protein
VKGAAGWAHCVAVTGNVDFLIVFQLRKRRPLIEAMSLVAQLALPGVSNSDLQYSNLPFPNY